MQEAFLLKKLDERRSNGAYRSLKLLPEGMIDFCSNDYLGLARQLIKNNSKDHNGNSQSKSGSTGSRLLTGNYPLIQELESFLAEFHNSESALIFNSGYDANLGLLGSVPQRGDTIFYDHLSHASIRDGIRLSHATTISFQHNDLDDLSKKLQSASGNLFVVTESVFSMDGDLVPLKDLSSLCNSFNANLIIDEAHATGVIGERGEGLVQHLGLERECFARIHTFGKAVGAHGAVILGSKQLIEYLINFCRAFIYTTALPEISIEHIYHAYRTFPDMKEERQHLSSLISLFQDSKSRFEKLSSTTPIQGVIVPGNSDARDLADVLQKQNLDIRPILYPTVPLGRERLRIILHSFNSSEEVDKIFTILA